MDAIERRRMLNEATNRLYATQYNLRPYATVPHRTLPKDDPEYWHWLKEWDLAKELGDQQRINAVQAKLSEIKARITHVS